MCEWGQETEREVERSCTNAQSVAELRCLAGALEKGNRFNIEHERKGDEGETEFQVKWTND